MLAVEYAELYEYGLYEYEQLYEYDSSPTRLMIPHWKRRIGVIFPVMRNNESGPAFQEFCCCFCSPDHGKYVGLVVWRAHMERLPCVW